MNNKAALVGDDNWIPRIAAFALPHLRLGFPHWLAYLTPRRKSDVVYHPKNQANQTTKTTGHTHQAIC